jgi:hypothetical protein
MNKKQNVSPEIWIESCFDRIPLRLRYSPMERSCVRLNKTRNVPGVEPADVEISLGKHRGLAVPGQEKSCLKIWLE